MQHAPLTGRPGCPAASLDPCPVRSSAHRPACPNLGCPPGLPVTSVSSSILAPSACRSAKRVSKEALLDCLSGRSRRHNGVRGHRHPLRDHLGPQPLGATHPMPSKKECTLVGEATGEEHLVSGLSRKQKGRGNMQERKEGTRPAGWGGAGVCARARAAVSPPAPR